MLLSIYNKLLVDHRQSHMHVRINLSKQGSFQRNTPPEAAVCVKTRVYVKTMVTKEIGKAGCIGPNSKERRSVISAALRP